MYVCVVGDLDHERGAQAGRTRKMTMIGRAAFATIAAMFIANGASAQMVGGPARQHNLVGPAANANPVVPPVRGAVVPTSPAFKPVVQARPVTQPVAPAPVRPVAAVRPIKKP
jgi:hypothetical protein